MSNETPQETKLNISQGSLANYIKIKVVDQDNNVIDFRLKKHTPLGKLKKLYSKRVGVSFTELKFVYNGNRFYDNDTPETLRMDNEFDIEIEVYQTQDGGFK